MVNTIRSRYIVSGVVLNKGTLPQLSYEDVKANQKLAKGQGTKRPVLVESCKQFSNELVF
jgi:hypothetical protein